MAMAMASAQIAWMAGMQLMDNFWDRGAGLSADLGSRRPAQSGLPLLEPGFDLALGETPLAAHHEATQATILQLPVDCNATHLEEVLQLSGCK
jgi:hypothetical protein